MTLEQVACRENHNDMKNKPLIFRYSWSFRCLAIVVLMLLITPILGAAEVLEIHTAKDIFDVGQEIVFQVKCNPGNNRGLKVDHYSGILLPDGHIEIVTLKTDRIIKNNFSEEIKVPSSLLKHVGQYHLFSAFVAPGSDLLQQKKWLEVVTKDVGYLPVPWSKSVFSRRFRAGGSKPELVAHGAGEIAGQTVTNSLEALNLAYANGYRYIELDFSWTADGHLVPIHDWNSSFQNLFGKKSPPPSLKEYDRISMKKGLTKLNFNDLLLWLDGHPEVRIITDIKSKNQTGLDYIRTHSQDKWTAFIPQIYAPEEYMIAKKLGFKDIIFTTYRSNLLDDELLDFAISQRLFAVTIPIARAINSRIALRLQQNGIYVFSHTVNQENFFMYLRTKGVNGVYTDRIKPEGDFNVSIDNNKKPLEN